MINFADALQLSTYPAWIKYALWGSGLAWFVVYSALVAFKPDPPKPELKVDSVRKAIHTPSGRLALVLQVRNATKEPASISALQIGIGKKPPGGLMSNQTQPQAYLVISGDNPNKVLSSPLGGDFLIDGTLSQPFAGQDYWRLQIPVAEQVEDQKSLQFIVIFDKTLAARFEGKDAQAMLRYNGSRDTTPAPVE